MNPQQVHEIVTTRDGFIALAAAEDSDRETNGTVWVFDLNGRVLTDAFRVKYDHGGVRLAVSPGQEVFFTGCYNAYGIAAYSLADGTELWRRKDLKGVQHIEALQSENLVFCGREKGPGHVLDAQTGRTVMELRGTKALYSSPYGTEVLVSARQLELHKPAGKRLVVLPRLEFAELDAAFSPNEVVISECKGPVRGVDIATAKVIWTKHSPEGTHYYRVCFCEETGCFIGFRSGGKESAAQIVFIDRGSGQVMNEVPVHNTSPDQLCLRGRAVFTTRLELIATNTGQLLHSFPMEPKPESKYAWLTKAELHALGVEYAHMTSEGMTEEEAKRHFFKKLVEEMRRKKDAERGGDSPS